MEDGETPTVPAGFRIEALATGLSNPRNLLALPNGDMLVVESCNEGKEPVDRPKDPIRDFIMGLSHGSTGGPPPESNRVTLIRDARWRRKGRVRTILLEDLTRRSGSPGWRKPLRG